MMSATYDTRRGELEEYFDRTAADTWARLTSDAPVSGVRATVRAGRNQMRATLLYWLPADLTGKRVLDAGCGTGALAFEAARRGAEVLAVDISPTLIGLAQERTAGQSNIEFRVGDMLDPGFGRFDHIVAMDSLIHYELADVTRALAGLAARANNSLCFTFAPRTPLLATMHLAGKLFPRGDRSPRIVPLAGQALRHALGKSLSLGRHHRVSKGFYISEAQELRAR
ncbi:MAG: magnesium protoporphyrin IX methyltransferase [Alphaproteobacteria bacterium]|nr:magnesium protoporphyrin IX methyltransferase [Alphaproteobacteria bacterium]